MDNIQILQECYSRVTLIPVVGSGLSIPMGLPSWRELIEKSADYFSISDEKKECICKCLDRNEYLDATEEYLKEALLCYKSKYGICTAVDNYIIYFEPFAVMKIITVNSL